MIFNTAFVCYNYCRRATKQPIMIVHHSLKFNSTEHSLSDSAGVDACAAALLAMGQGSALTDQLYKSVMSTAAAGSGAQQQCNDADSRLGQSSCRWEQSLISTCSCMEGTFGMTLRSARRQAIVTRASVCKQWQLGAASCQVASINFACQLWCMELQPTIAMTSLRDTATTTSGCGLCVSPAT